LPHQDHVYKTTDESFRFHNKKIDEIRCKLDATENPRSFEKYPTPPKHEISQNFERPFFTMKFVKSTQMIKRHLTPIMIFNIKANFW